VQYLFLKFPVSYIIIIKKIKFSGKTLLTTKVEILQGKHRQISKIIDQALLRVSRFHDFVFPPKVHGQ
jgi:hypothetical protein